MWLGDRSSRRKMLKKLVILVAGIFTAGVFGLAFVVHRFGQVERARKADAIVVLGARVMRSGVPSGALRARVEKAVQLYDQGYAPKIIFSGGVGHHGPSEAEVGRTLAMSLGVPESACVLEANSHSTEENARFSLALTKPSESLLVVSDPYHLLRARQIFRSMGRDVSVSPALMSERNFGALDLAYWTCREAFALLLHPRLLVAQQPRGTRT
ncbi:MAG: YdcF family protein [Myxococcaceae bacterium]